MTASTQHYRHNNKTFKELHNDNDNDRFFRVLHYNTDHMMPYIYCSQRAMKRKWFQVNTA